MKLQSEHADALRGSEILELVIDHQGVRRRQVVAIKQSDEDLRIRLCYPFEPGDHGAVEPTEKRKSLESKRVGLGFHVGEGVARESCLLQVAQDLD